MCSNLVRTFRTVSKGHRSLCHTDPMAFMSVCNLKHSCLVFCEWADHSVCHCDCAKTCLLHHEGESCRHAQQGLCESGRQSPTIQQGQWIQRHPFLITQLWYLHAWYFFSYKYCNTFIWEKTHFILYAALYMAHTTVKIAEDAFTWQLCVISSSFYLFPLILLLLQ